MPIFFQQDIGENTRLGIWEIKEDEGFFLRHVPLQKEITHPHKRLQHLAGRYLLRYLYPSFPVELIRIADTRKPFLEDEAFHFSISHCSDFAAVIVSPVNRVGIDIELASWKVEKIRHKFISETEETLLSKWGAENTVNRSTIIWSIKESVFKWYGLGGVDFRGHIQVESLIAGAADTVDSTVIFKKQTERFLETHSRIFGELCLSYVMT